MRDSWGVERLRDVTLEIRAGEIVGVAAVEGSGQHELMRVLAGLTTPASGRVSLPATIGFIPEDRHRDAILLDAPLYENIALKALGRVASSDARNGATSGASISVNTDARRAATADARGAATVDARGDERGAPRSAPRQHTRRDGNDDEGDIDAGSVTDDNDLKGAAEPRHRLPRAAPSLHTHSHTQSRPHFRISWRMPWRALRETTRSILARHDVRAPSELALARELSGGNQQKLVIGRELEDAPSLVVAENPSRGLDFHATAAVHAALRTARSDGAGVIVYSSDLDEVLALADRVFALHEGHLIPVPRSRTDLDRDALGRAMLGASEVGATNAQAGVSPADVHAEVRADVRGEVRAEVRAEVRGDVHGEVRGDVRSDVRNAHATGTTASIDDGA